MKVMAQIMMGRQLMALQVVARKTEASYDEYTVLSLINAPPPPNKLVRTLFLIVRR